MANDPLNLDESAEWAGLWWLPDDPDKQIPGVLRYEPEDGLVLSLIESFLQSGGMLVTSQPEGGAGQLLIFASARSIQVHGAVRAGDLLIHTVELVDRYEDTATSPERPGSARRRCSRSNAPSPCCAPPARRGPAPDSLTVRHGRKPWTST